MLNSIKGLDSWSVSCKTSVVVKPRWRSAALPCAISDSAASTYKRRKVAKRFASSGSSTGLLDALARANQVNNCSNTAAFFSAWRRASNLWRIALTLSAGVVLMSAVPLIPNAWANSFASLVLSCSNGWSFVLITSGRYSVLVKSSAVFSSRVPVPALDCKSVIWFNRRCASSACTSRRIMSLAAGVNLPSMSYKLLSVNWSFTNLKSSCACALCFARTSRSLFLTWLAVSGFFKSSVALPKPVSPSV